MQILKRSVGLIPHCDEAQPRHRLHRCRAGANHDAGVTSHGSHVAAEPDCWSVVVIEHRDGAAGPRGPARQSEPKALGEEGAHGPGIGSDDDARGTHCRRRDRGRHQPYGRHRCSRLYVGQGLPHHAFPSRCEGCGGGPASSGCVVGVKRCSGVEPVTLLNRGGPGRRHEAQYVPCGSAIAAGNAVGQVDRVSGIAWYRAASLDGAELARER